MKNQQTKKESKCLCSILSEKTNFTSKSLFLMLIPAILVLLSLVMFLIVGFNKDISIQKRYTANIEFKTTINSEDFDTTIKEVTKSLKNNNISKFEFSKANKNTMRAKLIINVSCNKISADDVSNVLNDCKSEITTYIINQYPDAVVSDFTEIKTMVNKVIPSICLAILFFALISFVYLWIRIEVVSAFATMLNIIFNSILLTSLIALFRIPISETIGLAFVTMLILTTVISAIVFNKIKALQYNDNFKASLNREYISSAFKIVIKPIFNVSLSLIVVTLIAMVVSFFVATPFAFTLIATLIAIIVSFYTSIYIGTCIWNSIYKKSKNKRIGFYKDLVAKKEQMKNGKVTSEDEKLIV